MSATMAATEARVRFFSRDVDLSAPAVDSRLLRQIILAHAQVDGAAIAYPDQTVASFVAVSDTGSPDFTPTLSVGQLEHLVALRRASDGYPVTLIAPAQLEAMRIGSDTKGRPQFAAILEGTSQVYTVRFYPRPNAADTIQAILQETMASTVTDATVIPLSALWLRRIELASASDAVSVMPPDQRAALGWDEAGMASLGRMAAEAREEAARTSAAQKRGPFGLHLGRWM